jgi:ribosome maturation factor RimP
LQVGDKIKLDNFEGDIESINNISVFLSSENKTVIIPIKEIVHNKIEILS